MIFDCTNRDKDDGYIYIDKYWVIFKMYIKCTDRYCVIDINLINVIAYEKKNSYIRKNCTWLYFCTKETSNVKIDVYSD